MVPGAFALGNWTMLVCSLKSDLISHFWNSPGALWKVENVCWNKHFNTKDFCEQERGFLRAPKAYKYWHKFQCHEYETLLQFLSPFVCACVICRVVMNMIRTIFSCTCSVIVAEKSLPKQNVVKIWISIFSCFNLFHLWNSSRFCGRFLLSLVGSNWGLIFRSLPAGGKDSQFYSSTSQWHLVAIEILKNRCCIVAACITVSTASTPKGSRPRAPKIRLRHRMAFPSLFTNLRISSWSATVSYSSWPICWCVSTMFSKK